MIRRWLVTIAIIGVIIVCVNYAPLLSTHSDQDECAFGPVSNEKYRAYLLEAQSRQQSKWLAFSRDDQEIGRQLNSRLSDMLSGEASLYERVAITHAILRAIGAEYLNTNGRKEPDPYDGANRRRQYVEFNYQVDINRLVFFHPYPRRLWIVANIPDPDLQRPETAKKYGDLSITAALVSVFDHPPDEFLASSGQGCPPSPTAEIAERYQAKRK
jgi:hypothetical protein